MKRPILLSFMIVFILPYSYSQKYKLGDKAEGGIIIEANKKSGIVVSETVLGLLNWDEGKKACEELELNGYNDWKLPSLSDLSVTFYVFYLKGKIILPAGFYWSRFENTGIRQLGWSFDFIDGQQYNSHPKANKKYILSVRTYSLK